MRVPAGQARSAWSRTDRHNRGADCNSRSVHLLAFAPRMALVATTTDKAKSHRLYPTRPGIGKDGGSIRGFSQSLRPEMPLRSDLAGILAARRFRGVQCAS